VIHDETAGLVDAASDINGALMNACDRMLEAQVLAAE
jgi:hypothetical protein